MYSVNTTSPNREALFDCHSVQPKKLMKCYGNRCFMLRKAALLLALVALLSKENRARADVVGATFHSPEWKVSISAPANWTLSEQVAYPNILVRITRRAPEGELILAAELVGDKETSKSYAERTAKLLQELKFSLRAPDRHPTTGAYLIDAQRGPAFIRQAYLVQNGIGYSLTLSANDAPTRSQLLRAFDIALRSLQFDQ
jgi:hypothetical protein